MSGAVFDCSASAALDRLKDKLSVTRDAQLAAHLAVAGTNIAKWRRRNSVPYELILGACATGGIDLDWILIGRPSPWTQGAVGA